MAFLEESPISQSHKVYGPKWNRTKSLNSCSPTEMAASENSNLCASVGKGDVSGADARTSHRITEWLGLKGTLETI